MNGTAVLSPGGQFRYTLSRRWGPGPCGLLWIMCNPSTADAQIPDPTITKCVGFARRWGFDGFHVVNLWAFRATYPRDLKAAGYPVGPDNDAHIFAALCASTLVVCAWGANARGHPRAAQVLQMVRDMRREPMALEVLAGGVPAHPLMQPYARTLAAL